MEKTCEICDSTEFRLVDNMHCCMVCGTVNQTMGTLLQQEDTFEATFNPLQSTTIVNRKASVAKKVKTVDRGRPWKSDEGFQFIIMEQVKALIALGAPSNLKEAAFKIWAMYLRHTGRAFCKLQHKSSNPNPYISSRDKYLGTMEDARVRKVDYFISSRTTWFKKKLFDMDNTLDDGGLFGEDIVEDDEKEEKEDDDEDGDEEKEDGDGGDDDELDKAIDTSEGSKKGGKRRKRESRVDKAGDFSFLRDESFTEVNLNVSKVKNLRKKKRLFGSERHVEGVEDERERWLLRMVKVEKRKKKLKEGEQEPDEIKFDVNRKPHVHKRPQKEATDWTGRTNLLKCLSITYLALQATNPQILLHDLLRLVVQGHVPYQKFPNWPSDMHFFANDYEIFSTYKTPTIEQVAVMSQRLARYANLNCFRKVNVRMVIARFLLELSLPVELMRVVNQLLTTHEPNLRLRPTTTKSPLPAIVAMAFVVFALKLLFALDDQTEIRISEAVRRLQKHYHLGKPLFNWSEWVAHCEKIFCRKRVLDGVRNLRDMAFAQHVGEVLAQKDQLGGQAQRLQKDFKNSPRSGRSSLSSWYVKRIAMLNGQRETLIQLRKNIDAESEEDGEVGNTDNRIKEEREEHERGGGGGEEREREGNEGKQKEDTTAGTVKHHFTTSSFTYSSLHYLFDPHAFSEVLSSLPRLPCSEPCPQDHFRDSSNRKPSHVIRDFKARLEVDKLPWHHYKMHVDVPEKKIYLKKFSLPTIDFEASLTGDTKRKEEKKTKTERMGRSMQWLLQRCSRHINCSSDALYDWVRCLEDIYFDGVMKSKLEQRRRLKQFYDHFSRRALNKKIDSGGEKSSDTSEEEEEEEKDKPKVKKENEEKELDDFTSDEGFNAQLKNLGSRNTFCRSNKQNTLGKIKASFEQDVSSDNDAGDGAGVDDDIDEDEDEDDDDDTGRRKDYFENKHKISVTSNEPKNKNNDNDKCNSNNLEAPIDSDSDDTNSSQGSFFVETQKVPKS